MEAATEPGTPPIVIVEKEEIPAKSDDETKSHEKGDSDTKKVQIGGGGKHTIVVEDTELTNKGHNSRKPNKGTAAIGAVKRKYKTIIRTLKKKRHKYLQMPDNLNMTAAFAHLLADIVRGVSVLISGLIIWIAGTRGVVTDAYCSILVSVFILTGTISAGKKIYDAATFRPQSDPADGRSGQDVTSDPSASGEGGDSPMVLQGQPAANAMVSRHASPDRVLVTNTSRTIAEATPPIGMGATSSPNKAPGKSQPNPSGSLFSSINSYARFEDEEEPSPKSTTVVKVEQRRVVGLRRQL